MGQFLALYGGDILVGACIVAGVISVIRTMRRDKKAGRGGCSGDCAHCGSACHREK